MEAPPSGREPLFRRQAAYKLCFSRVFVRLPETPPWRRNRHVNDSEREQRLRQARAQLASWPVLVQLPVQWGDQDALGHVNNVVFFRWFESARVALLQQLGIRTQLQERLGTILAATDCNYRIPLTYPDEVLVATGVLRLGRSSIRMAQQVFSLAAGHVAAAGTATVVVFDYRQQRPTPIPEPMREQLQQFLLPAEIANEFSP